MCRISRLSLPIILGCPGSALLWGRFQDVLSGESVDQVPSQAGKLGVFRRIQAGRRQRRFRHRQFARSLVAVAHASYFGIGWLIDVVLFKSHTQQHRTYTSHASFPA